MKIVLPMLSRVILLVLPSLFSASCQPNYHLLHPLQPSSGIYRESITFDQADLRVHWIAYYPDQGGKLPAILIHPDRGALSWDMEGTCQELARNGFFAAATHYQRLENLKDENPLIPWKSDRDSTVSIGHLMKHPRVDPTRIGLLGYSRGAILSLLIASQEPSIKGVVAYYGLGNIEQWLDLAQYPFPKSLIFRYIRDTFVDGIGASGWEAARPKFREISPIHRVNQIRSPILLIHGEKDRTAPLRQAQELCQAFYSIGRPCELFVVPAAGHVFNYLDPQKGLLAWKKTIDFFNHHLKKE